MLKIGTEADSEFADYRGAAAIEVAGFGWYRHLQIDWATREPKRGTYIETPSAWDAALDVGLARAAQSMIPVAVVRNSPAWATTSGEAGCAAIKPECYADFAQFLDWLITRYEQAPCNVRHYELWNEPDATAPPDATERGCWATAAEYVAMLKVVYPYIKERHPGVMLLNGGFAEVGAWAHEFFLNGGVDFVDAVAFHAYDIYDSGTGLWKRAGDIQPASEYIARLSTLSGWLAHVQRPNKPLYMTEGSLIHWGNNVNQEDYQRACSYFAAWMCAQMLSVVKVLMYNWWASQSAVSAFGQTVNWEYKPNSIYTALAFGIQQTRGAAHLATVRKDNYSIIKLLVNDGTQRWLVWRWSVGNVTLPASAQAWDVWGNEVALSMDMQRVLWVMP